MTRTSRISAIGLILTLGPTHRVAAAEVTGLPRVRSTSPRLAAVIEDARERSQTFRNLTETINESDGIVYVQEGQCGHGVRACFTRITVAGTNRVLWVRIDTTRVDWNADWDLMGAIGHELRHAIEVLRDPTVRDDTSKHLFYALSAGSRSAGNPDAFETDAAILAGLQIRAEARRRASLFGGAISLAAEHAIPTTRVRSEHSVISAAIVAAMEHSATFRAMVEGIERTDGIMYVHEGSCRFGLSACLTTVYRAPPVRFVHIKVDLRKAVGCELMSSIGHELHHALEVLGNPKIIDNQTLAHLYIREGEATHDDNRFETESAIEAGLQVQKELHARSMCRG